MIILTIKERVQSVLKEKGISAKKLENDLGFAKGYLSKLDKSFPTTDKILKIADYLEVSTDKLLKDEDKEYFFETDPSSVPEKQLLEYWRKLDAKSQEYFLGIAEKMASEDEKK